MTSVPPPHPEPLGINPKFMARRTETILIKENLNTFGKTEFTIDTGDGRPLLQVKGDGSFAARKNFLDLDGALLYSLRKEKMATLPVIYAKVADGGPRLFEVRSKWKLLGSKTEITFTNVSGREETLVIEGDYKARGGELKHERTGLTVAVIEKKKSDIREIFGGGKKQYAVTVAENVDLSLIAGVCVAADECRNENEGRP